MASKTKFDFFTVFGVVFLTWGIFDLLLKIFRYGFWEYDFMWFCSFNLFLLGLGLLIRNPLLLNSFLSVGLVVQPIWILDYFWIIFFGQPLNNNAAYIFQPSNTLVEFFNSLRHLLMLPFGFYGWYLLKKKSKNAWIVIILACSFVLGFSVLFTHPANNINCVFEPCTKILDLGLPQNIYFIIFLLTIILTSIIISFILNLIIGFLKTRKLKKHKKNINRFVFAFFTLMLVVVSIMIVKGALIYFKIPKYKCNPLTECENCKIDLQCRYTTKLDEEFFLFYTISNKNTESYLCDLYFIEKTKEGGKSKLITKNLYIHPNYKKDFTLKISYPNEDTRLIINPSCKKA